MKKSALFIILIFLFVGNSFAVEIAIWGPNKYIRTSGAPNIFTETISTTPGQSKLVVKNGATSGDNRVEDSLSSATISVNGEQIFGPSDFNMQVYLLEVPLNLAENNELSIELASSLGSYLTIEIVRDVALPPDPGDAGKETLLGIDSDNDGVRDDIQRYIYFNYPDDESVKLLLMESAKLYQQLLPQADDLEAGMIINSKLILHGNCLFYLKQRESIGIKNAFLAEILNTKERSLAYINFSKSLAGKTAHISSGDLKNDCYFDVDTMGENQ